MGLLQRVLTLINTRLRDVNPSQRVALILGGALVAAALLGLGQWAAAPEQSPLLDQELQPDELARVQTALQMMQIDHQVRENRVYIPTGANRAAILARLQEEGQLPSNTTVGLAAMVKESDPWISQEENNRRWTWALQTELERILSEFEGVRDAHVVLNFNTQQRSFTRTAPPSSASVTLNMKGGEEVPRRLALAAARLVSGAVAGLAVKNVQVVDAGGRSALDWDIEQDPASALKAYRQQEEKRFTDLIRRQVPDPQALVSVRVELNSTASRTETSTPSRGVERSTETTTEQRSKLRPNEQPGVQPNVAVAAAGARADESDAREMNKTEYATGVAMRTETRPAGDVESVTAAISLSSSYLEGVYRVANPEAAPPTDTDLEAIFQAERKRLAGQLALLVKPPSEENVAISRHYDSALAPPGPQTAGVLAESMDLLKQHGPQAGLALLALASFGLMMRLARKNDGGESLGLELGLPREAIAAARSAAADVAELRKRGGGRTGRRSGGEGEMALGDDGVPAAGAVLDVGAAQSAEGVLVAQEVDEITVQSRKMLDQITTMTDSDAAGVAALLESWIQRNELYREAS